MGCIRPCKYGMGWTTYEVVQDFFHQLYHVGSGSIEMKSLTLQGYPPLPGIRPYLRGLLRDHGSEWSTPRNKALFPGVDGTRGGGYPEISHEILMPERHWDASYGSWQQLLSQAQAPKCSTDARRFLLLMGWGNEGKGLICLVNKIRLTRCETSLDG